MIEDKGTDTSRRVSDAKVMGEAIHLAIEGRSPYTERSAFIGADTPSAGHDIARAADEGLSIVLVSGEAASGPQAGITNALTSRCWWPVGRIAAPIPLPTPTPPVLSSRRSRASTFVGAFPLAPC